MCLTNNLSAPATTKQQQAGRFWGVMLNAIQAGQGNAGAKARLKGFHAAVTSQQATSPTGSTAVTGV